MLAEARAALAREGAWLATAGAAGCMDALEQALACRPAGRAGCRITGDARLRLLLAEGGPIGRLAAAMLGPHTRPVRAVLFDKSADAAIGNNWALGWHQDRTICVAGRIEVAGFGPWTRKQGLDHVMPPFALLERMVTLRVHCDDVPQSNAPLLVAPGSHRLGLVPQARIEEAVRRSGSRACLAERGDVWLYATPILHASAACVGHTRRRVLQVDYAAEALPGGLQWLGV